MLLEQDGGVVAPVLRKLGVDPGAVRQALTPALDALPKLSSGAQEPAGGSTELTQVIRDAEKEMRALDDEYVSTEHLMLSIASHPGKAGDALRSSGASHDSCSRRSPRSAAATGSPTRAPRTSSRRSSASRATSPRRPRRGRSIR